MSNVAQAAVEEIERWLSLAQVPQDLLSINRSPMNDPDDSYEVATEFVVDSPKLDQLRIEIWIATDGSVAVGIESYRRIAERIGGKEARSRFGTGHEPANVPIQALKELLELARSGKISLSVLHVPFFGIVSVRGVLLEEDRDRLISAGYPDHGWMREALTPEKAARLGRRHLQYSPWAFH